MLQRLNIVAVAASLATCTGALLTGMFGERFFGPTLSSGAACAVSTFLYGLVWARVLRWRGGLWSWLLSVPLAALNAGTACLLCTWSQSSVESFALGATLGIFIWAPALIVTLLCFGLPIHLARRAAEHGLSSEDRGERTVGIVALVLGAAGLGVLYAVNKTIADVYAVGSLGLLAVGTGTISGLFAHLRERRRRQFIDRVREGNAVGYRIEDTVVVRVTEQGHAYRGSTLAEPVVILDESGDARSRLSEMIER